MAESSSRMAVFKAKKEIFDNVSNSIVCSSCEIVPRDTPIYQAEEGLVLCSKCKPKSNLSGIYRSFHMENLLEHLPISCKYQMNECPVVQDKKNIAYHEEDCEFREVVCPYLFCKEGIVQNMLNHHLNQIHKRNTKKVEKGASSVSEGLVHTVLC